MKLKRIFAFLLTLALVLGALPLAAFAAYTAPTAEEIEAAIADEENSDLVYANNIEGVKVTPTTTGTENNTTSTISFTSDITKGTYFSYAKVYDQGTYKGRTNVYATADGNGILWKSHSKNMNDTSDNNNCLDIGFKADQPVGKSFVLEFDYTMYQEAFDGDNVAFRVINRNRTFDSYNFVVIEDKTGNLVPTIDGIGASDIVLAAPAVGETTNVAVHVKIADPSKEGAHGSVVFDVYINGELKGANLVMYSEATLTSKGLYAKNYAPEYFRLGNSVGETIPYGLSCDEEDHTACGTECPYGKDLYSFDSVKIYYSDVCYSSVHGTEPHTFSEFGRIDEVYHGIVCSECGASSNLGLHNLSAEGYCSICEAGITGTSLAIDSDLAIRYYVDAYAPFIEGKTLTLNVAGTVIDTYKTEGGKYIFTYDGIGPHQVGNNVTATLYVGDTAVSSKTYSVEQYCREALKLYAGDAKLVRLVNDLLIYANAAGAYKEITSPVDITGITASDATPNDTDDKLVHSGNTDALYIAAAGVEFNSQNRLFFKIASAGGAFTATIDGKTYQASELDTIDGYYVVYSDTMTPTEYDDVKTLTVAEGANTVTVSYSANSYAYRMQNDDEMSALAVALYRFGKSCETYLAAEATNNIIYDLGYEGATVPETYPTTYNPEGGTVLPTPTRDDYYFSGWYTSPDFSESNFATDRITEVPAGTSGELSVYAKWNKIIYQEDFNNSTQELTSKSFSINDLNIATSTSSGIVEATDEQGGKYLQLNLTTNSIAADTKNYDFDGTTTKTLSIQFDLLGENINSLGYVGFRFYYNGTNAATNKYVLVKLSFKDVKTTAADRITYRLVFDLNQFDTTPLLAYSEDGTCVSRASSPSDPVSGYNIGYGSTASPAKNSLEDFISNLNKVDFIIQASKNKTVGVDNIVVAEGNMFE